MAAWERTVRMRRQCTDRQQQRTALLHTRGAGTAAERCHYRAGRPFAHPPLLQQHDSSVHGVQSAALPTTAPQAF
jgi:hypothetical protein